MKKRSFLKTTLATTAYGMAPFNILRAGESPNSKLNVAIIGCGRQGSSNARSLQNAGANIVALCDVHESWHKKAIQKQKSLHGIKLWTDYRVMYDRIGKDIDAVCVATPEHNHYAISTFFIRRGIHVYCQKPLCHTMWETREIAKEAREHKVVTQMGNQGHSSQSSSNIYEWVREGAIGKVREVNTYMTKNYWTNQPVIKGSTCPRDLNWDLYLNRVPEIPYSESYANREWIRYNHFSGAVGDMGAHTLDAAYYSLDLKVPLSVRAEVDVPAKPWSLPPGGLITWEFGARGDMPPVTLRYYLGTANKKDLERPKHLEPKRKFDHGGNSYIIGETGTIMSRSHSQSGRIIPEVRMKEVGMPSGSSYRNQGKGHFGNFVLACKGTGKAMSNFEYAGPLSEMIVLGDIALMHPNRTLEWDAKNMQITNDEEANNSIFMRHENPRDAMSWV